MRHTFSTVVDMIAVLRWYCLGESFFCVRKTARGTVPRMVFGCVQTPPKVGILMVGAKSSGAMNSRGCPASLMSPCVAPQSVCRDSDAKEYRITLVSQIEAPLVLMRMMAQPAPVV